MPREKLMSHEQALGARGTEDPFSVQLGPRMTALCPAVL